MSDIPADLAATVLALAGFAFVTSITPGPNNFMLMSSGARAGFRATLPHMLGVVAGMVGLLLLSYVGVGSLVARHPGLRQGMSWACALYLVWLAIKLLRDRTPLTAATDGGMLRTLSFGQAAIFQLVNPKAWAMAVSGAAMVLATPAGYLGGLALLIAVFSSVNLPCIALWAAWGALMRRYLARPRVKLVFDVSMATLVLLTACSMVRV